MNLKLAILSLAALLSATPVLQARHHHHRHGPRFSFGMHVGYPVAVYPRPYYAPAPYVAAPCYSCHTPYCRPVVVAPAPVVRPHVGFSIGHGPVGFSFSV